MFSLHKIIVSTFVLFLPITLFAGDPYRLVTGAREAGMAKTGLMEPGLWTVFHNQAMLAYTRRPSVGFNYQNRFGIGELGTRSAGVVLPAGRVSFGAAYSHFGYSDFRRESIGLASGMALSGIAAAGVQIDYFAERSIGEYNQKQALTFEAGLIISEGENTRFGLHIFNPVPNSLRKSDLPAGISAGVSVRLSNEFSAAFESSIFTGQKPIVCAGFEYEIAKMLKLRGGFSTESTSFCFGVGYKAGPVVMDFGFATHEKLGMTSSVSMVIEFGALSQKNNRNRLKSK